MATISSSNVSAIIPNLTDTADINAAFTNYHNSIVPNIISNITSFTNANISFKNVVAQTVVANIVPSSNTSGKITVNVASGSFVTTGRIFVQSTQPTGSNVATGDIWIW